MNNVVQNVVVQVGIVVLFIGILFVCYGLVGNGDYESAVLLEKDYCENLRNNLHEDYKGIEDTCYARYYGNPK